MNEQELNYKVFIEIQNKLETDEEFANKFYQAITDSIIPYNNDLINLGEPYNYSVIETIKLDIINKSKNYRRF